MEITGTYYDDLERIVEKWHMAEKTISEEQFGFMPEKGTIDVVFVLRWENIRKSNRDYMWCSSISRTFMTGYPTRSLELFEGERST